MYHDRSRGAPPLLGQCSSAPIGRAASRSRGSAGGFSARNESRSAPNDALSDFHAAAITRSAARRASFSGSRAACRHAARAIHASAARARDRSASRIVALTNRSESANADRSEERPYGLDAASVESAHTAAVLKAVVLTRPSVSRRSGTTTASISAADPPATASAAADRYRQSLERCHALAAAESITGSLAPARNAAASNARR